MKHTHVNVLTQGCQALTGAAAWNHHIHGHPGKTVLFCSLVVFTWLLSHINFNTSRASEYIRGLNAKRMVFFVPLVAALLSGCVLGPSTPGRVVSVDEHGFGLILEQSTSTQTPTAKLGFFSSRVVLMPVFTNVTTAVPNYANTFALDDTGTPFTFGVNESFAAGDYYAGDPMNGNTNGIAAMPIIPTGVSTNFDPNRAALEAALNAKLSNTNK